MKALTQRLVVLISMYAPMFLLLGLSALSYWIWQNNPAPGKDRKPSAPATPPDMVMFDATVQRFDATNGVLRIGLEGKTILRHTAQKIMEVQNARGQQHAADGTRSDFSANTAWVTEEMDEARLVGDARVSYQGPDSPQSRLSGPQLHVFTVARVVQSDTPVVFERGKDVVRAGTLHYDDISGLLSLGGRVQATLVPAATGGTP